MSDVSAETDMTDVSAETDMTDMTDTSQKKPLTNDQQLEVLRNGYFGIREDLGLLAKAMVSRIDQAVEGSNHPSTVRNKMILRMINETNVERVYDVASENDNFIFSKLSSVQEALRSLNGTSNQWIEQFKAIITKEVAPLPLDE